MTNHLLTLSQITTIRLLQIFTCFLIITKIISTVLIFFFKVFFFNNYFFSYKQLVKKHYCFIVTKEIDQKIMIIHSRPNRGIFSGVLINKYGMFDIQIPEEDIRKNFFLFFFIFQFYFLFF